MENASKALIMAGGVLISLLVISLLVMFFNNLSSWQSTETQSDVTQQATEFNKQYDVYSRDIYGSELLSIANKILDYNKRQSSEKGYTQIELYVIIQNNIDSQFFKKGTYTSSQIQSKMDEVESKMNEVGNKTVKSTNGIYSRKVSALAVMRTTDIEDLGIDVNSCKDLISEYNTYKSLISEMKSKVFKYVEFDYDKNNGRIIKMTYKV